MPLPPVRKSLGQHFLRDQTVLAAIADALALTPADTVVEIGPGRGALTDELLARAGRVVAIEIDRALAGVLRVRYAAEPRLTIVEADALTVDFASLAGADYMLAGNVPYYITTPLIFHALARPRPSRAVFLVQREVGVRMAAPPGNGEYGALSVNVQATCQVELLRHVPASAFSPPPKVESAIVRLSPRPDPMVPEALEERFRTFVQEVFGLRRKQMRRVLRTVGSLDPDRATAVLEQAGIDPATRPETLSPADFARVLAALDEAR